MNEAQPNPRGGRTRRAVGGLIAVTVFATVAALSLPAEADPSQTPVESKPMSQLPTPSAGDSQLPADSAPSAPETRTPTAAAPTAASATDIGPSATEETSGDSTSPTAAEPSSPTPSAGVRAASTDDRAITLAVSPAGSPMAGRYFENIGQFAFTGKVGAPDASHPVTIYRRASGSTSWLKLAQPLTALDGTFAVSVPVTDRGTFTLAASIAGSPADSDAIVSNQLVVKVEDSTIRLYSIVRSIDALKDPTVSGMIWPVRPSTAVAIDAQVADGWAQAATARAGSDGRFSLSLGWGRGKLQTYRIRARYTTPNRHLAETSSTATFSRVPVIDAVIADTTSADVAKTYRAGCPVGPSKLSTITMNFYGFDQLMHRGVLIVRRDLTSKVIRGFSSALAHRYPISKMNNPNVYGGNDPTQMAADNTSGFNCRKVVGNPYAMSPHSYGIAIDVNTVQNPYRDAQGKWWPANGHSYIKRSPLRAGMLNTGSALTKSLRHDKFFWGGFWSPGKDYQHFEYRG